MANFGRDANGIPAPTLPPAAVPVAVTYDATISSSTEVTLNASTTLIDVMAIDKAVLLAWGTDDASTSNVDVFIPANTNRLLWVPLNITALNVIEQAATAIVCISEYA